MLGKRPPYVRLRMGLDQRERIFDDAGDCLGVVIPEHEIETDIDADPIGFFRGFLIAAAYFAILAGMLTMAFFLGTRWHS